ncbi:MAG: RNA polymerase subunit sigma, partial [bacterium]|nr:RNA polymerase subunit sigma [bacterium]
MSDVTQVLRLIENGDPQASEDLLPLVYLELRSLAGKQLKRESAAHTLQPTALVHEAYLRLVGPEEPQTWNSRGHFFRAAAEAMRRILIESARSKKRVKRGGDYRRVEVPLSRIGVLPRDDKLLALDEALTRLAATDPRAAKLVELRFFAGLTMKQAADASDVSLATAERDWA